MNFKHLLTLFTGLIECMCFAGITFGWASLMFVLKKENYFQDLCPSSGNQSVNTTESCPQQDERFSLIFTIATFMNNFMTFPCGYIFDRFGTAVTRFIAISIYTAALLLIALSSADTAILLFPALPLLATGGILLMLTNMQVANLFGKHRSTIITFYNGAFDSSSVIFLIFKVLYQNGVSLYAAFVFYSCCSIWHIVRTLFLMPKMHIPHPVPEGYSYGLQCQKSDTSNHLESSRLSNSEKQCGSVEQVADGNINSLLENENKGVVPFWQCAFSSLFAFHFIWLSLMQLRHYMFIGTLNPTVTRLSGGDQDIVSHFTNVFAISQFCGVICAPWNGLLMDRHKRKQKVSDSSVDLRASVLSLTVTTAQCLLFSICAALSMLPALYPTFILQVLNRSFLYGGSAAFLAIAFPSEHFGKLYGLVMCLSAVVSLLQYPAFYIIRTHLHGDPFYIDITLLILVLLTFIHPINVFRVCKQKKHAKEG
ncbi:equilibrative nucleobase transporter 1 isoform X2 [Spea bombifrons]|uniref:equilibrative nucleobase transporter 1 isoform X2 n=1 Tax=Spea bombifrons TaxID=233779 RepID=UPI00234BE2E4|nr:equilibrative nucleobase transporter 1 isoform X2 [Spea bombifrons]